MTAETSAVPRRSIWHPLAVAGALTALTVAVTGAAGAAGAAGVAGAAGAGGSPAWSALGLWICMGLAAGFATSGST